MSKVFSSQISVLLSDANDLYHWEHIMQLSLEQLSKDRQELLKVVQYQQSRDLSAMSESEVQQHKLKEYRLGLKLRNYDSFAEVIRGLYSQLLTQRQQQQDQVRILHDLIQRLRADGKMWKEMFLAEIETSQLMADCYNMAINHYNPLNQQQVDEVASRLMRTSPSFRKAVILLHKNGIQEI
jgi:hypothetical protein